MNSVVIILWLWNVYETHPWDHEKPWRTHWRPTATYYAEAFISRFASIFMFSLNSNLLLSKCLCAGTMRDEMPWQLNASILLHKRMVAHGLRVNEWKKISNLKRLESLINFMNAAQFCASMIVRLAPREWVDAQWMQMMYMRRNGPRLMLALLLFSWRDLLWWTFRAEH